MAVDANLSGEAWVLERTEGSVPAQFFMFGWSAEVLRRDFCTDSLMQAAACAPSPRRPRSPSPHTAPAAMRAQSARVPRGAALLALLIAVAVTHAVAASGVAHAVPSAPPPCPLPRSCFNLCLRCVCAPRAL